MRHKWTNLVDWEILNEDEIGSSDTDVWCVIVNGVFLVFLDTCVLFKKRLYLRKMWETDMCSRASVADSIIFARVFCFTSIQRSKNHTASKFKNIIIDRLVFMLANARAQVKARKHHTQIVALVIATMWIWIELRTLNAEIAI